MFKDNIDSKRIFRCNMNLMTFTQDKKVGAI